MVIKNMPQPALKLRLAFHTGTASTSQSGARQATMRLSLKPALGNRVFHCAAERSRPASNTCNPVRTSSTAFHVTCFTPMGISTQAYVPRTRTVPLSTRAGMTASSRVQTECTALRCR